MVRADSVNVTLRALTMLLPTETVQSLPSVMAKDQNSLAVTENVTAPSMPMFSVTLMTFQPLLAFA